MKAKVMKSMKRKAMKKSIIARGKRGKSSVFRGTKVKTVGGLKKTDLMKNKRGKVVSRKGHAQGVKRFQKNGLSKWVSAVQKARKALNVKGFCAVGGKKGKGKELLAKARSFYKKMSYGIMMKTMIHPSDLYFFIMI